MERQRDRRMKITDFKTDDSGDRRRPGSNCTLRP